MSRLTVSDIKIGEMPRSDYVIPKRVTYYQDGKTKTWDYIQIDESISVIIYNIDRQCLICVKQFRPGVYAHSIPKSERNRPIDLGKYQSTLGETIEFCAGLVDKDKSLVQIVAEEIEEETGYIIDPKNLEEIKSFRAAIGIAGAVTTLYYIEVTDEQKKAVGGGIHNEVIDIVELTMDEAEEMMIQPKNNSPAEFLFGLLWFLHFKKKT